MEKTSIPQPQEGTITSHFSHPHPLRLTTYNQTLNLTSPCSGCKLESSGMIYACTTCDFYLHKNCFEMPKKMRHPFHFRHSLALLPNAPYRFICDACGEKGKEGFSYHCKKCGVDLHMQCAALPFSVNHDLHAHKLVLTSEVPYETNKFYCGICKSTSGSFHWLYRCDSCGFDAHLNCARGIPSVPSNEVDRDVYNELVEKQTVNNIERKKRNIDAALAVPDLLRCMIGCFL